MRYSQFVAPLLGACFAAVLASCATGGYGSGSSTTNSRNSGTSTTTNSRNSGTTTSSSMSREQVKADRDAFLASHTWDEAEGTWLPKDAAAGSSKDSAAGSSSGVTRAEVKAKRDAFLAQNKFDEQCICWRPIQGSPRDLSTMSREEVKSETADFARTHTFDETTGMWVDK